MDVKKAYSFLQQYMTEERDMLFRKVAAERTRHIAMVVENLYQAHNASAVMRSCDCFGVQNIHVIENDNQWEVNEGVSMGSAKWLTVHRHNQLPNNTRSCLQELKKGGYKIVATTPHEDDFTLKTLPIDKKVAVVFGTELTGITDDVRAEADMFLRIPMYGFTESFNISVAAALTLYELTDRMRNEQLDWKLTEQEIDNLLFDWSCASVRNSDALLKRWTEGSAP